MTKPTLSEFFLSHFTKIWIRGRKLDSKTESSYGESIKHWKALTGDPPLDQITDLVIAKFCEDLSAQPGKKRGTTMMPNSSSKHIRQLDTVLKLAGPKNRNNPLGQKLITDEEVFFDVPAIKKSKKDKDWTIEEIRAMYAACHIMKRPLGADSPDFWRGVIVLGYYAGLRVFALTHVKFTDLYVTPTERWLTAPDGISKGKRGCKCWLPQLAVDHIERLRPLGHAEILHVPQFNTRRRLLYEDIERLQVEAGIAAHRHFRFHGYRSTYATIIGNLQRPHQEDVRLAQQGCGHSSSAITLGHYLSGSQESLRLAESIEQMPPPCPLVELAPRPSPVPSVYRSAIEFID